MCVLRVRKRSVCVWGLRRGDFGIDRRYLLPHAPRSINHHDCLNLFLIIACRLITSVPQCFPMKHFPMKHPPVLSRAAATFAFGFWVRSLRY